MKSTKYGIFRHGVNAANQPGTDKALVAQAVAPWRRENETLRSNCDHLSSENAGLARQVESMALRIESLAEELAKLAVASLSIDLLGYSRALGRVGEWARLLAAQLPAAEQGFDAARLSGACDQT